MEGLGEFLELEAVLADGEDEEAGMREFESIMRRTGVGNASLVAGAHVDLLRG